MPHSRASRRAVQSRPAASRRLWWRSWRAVRRSGFAASGPCRWRSRSRRGRRCAPWVKTEMASGSPCKEKGPPEAGRGGIGRNGSVRGGDSSTIVHIRPCVEGVPNCAVQSLAGQSASGASRLLDQKPESQQCGHCGLLRQPSMTVRC